MTRVLTGALLVALSLGVIGFAPAWLFWLLLAGTAVLASAELSRLLAAAGHPGWRSLAMAGVVATLGGFAPHGPPHALVLSATLLVVFVSAIASGRASGESAGRVTSTLFHVLYLGVTFGHVGALYSAEGGPPRGAGLLLFAIASVYVGDIAAYYGGRALGRRRLAPAVSPKKTWEGAVCGVAGAAAAAWASAHLALVGHGALVALALGAVAGMAGIAGDLSESVLKRAAGMKDSSTLLPGHGGVLDRLDSLLFAAPVVFWIDRWLAGPV